MNAVAATNSKLYLAFVGALGLGLAIWGVPSWIALLCGIALALVTQADRPAMLKPVTTYVLQFGVVALGAGMNLHAVLQGGIRGLAIAALSVVLALGVGVVVGRALGVTRDLTLLVSVGTAICGGSAIAAVSSVVKPKASDASVAFAVVFVLNAVALILFPPLGHLLNLTQVEFGRWAALAIHDTSSVVGAGLHYGATACDVATTTKLARALFIVPLTFGIAFYRSQGKERGLDEVKWPWFILAFIVVAALVTFVPGLSFLVGPATLVGRHTLVLALYLIGFSLSRKELATVGARPLVFGVVLWILVGLLSLPVALYA